MYSLLDELSKKKNCQEFLEEKKENGHFRRFEQKKIEKYIENEGYISLIEGGLKFSPPQKKLVNKIETGKKRVVYQFAANEVWVLKLLCSLLYKYDDKINKNCYSFRKANTAQKAVKSIMSVKGLRKKYCVKVDIHNYFNSIPAERLVDELGKIIDDDPRLLEFLKDLLLSDEAMENGVLIKENRGAMAGCPLSPFFANIYLMELDEYFEDQNIPYYRYSDDMVFFADTAEDAEFYKNKLTEIITKRGLEINPKKCSVTDPGESWEFLGFGYVNGKIDLSRVTKQKIKGKIKRKAKALYRWRMKKNLSYDKAAKALIKHFNYKFYDDMREGDFSWSRWFFPALTTSNGLKEIDEYLIEYIRYLYSGRHYKGNYKFKYDEIKRLGFRSLVNEYYKIKNKDDLDENKSKI